MWQEFKEFAIRGNAVDPAIGIIIGVAFAPILKTLAADILMPVIGYATAGTQFSSFAIIPIEGVHNQYGHFLNALAPFISTALALFLIIKYINVMRRPPEAPPEPAAPPQSELYLKEIRGAVVKAN